MIVEILPYVYQDFNSTTFLVLQFPPQGTLIGLATKSCPCAEAQQNLIFTFVILPISWHRFPLYPERQSHVKELPTFLHFPPLKHGLELHGDSKIINGSRNNIDDTEVK